MSCYTYKGIKYTEQELKSVLQKEQPKVRRILELQSDLFQKGRDKDNIVTPYTTKETSNQSGNKIEDIGDIRYVYDVDDNVYKKAIKNGETNSLKWNWTDITKDEFEKATGKIKNEGGTENQFLQLLNKDNNWVTFFVKSIIQSSAKQTVTEVQQEDVEAKVRELEKEGLLEIDCKGKLKAEKGLATSFTKGGKWKVIKDLKGYPTHKEGGVDLTIGKDGVSIKNGNTQFTAKYGLVIPKN